jgi:hypothetical protein
MANITENVKAFAPVYRIEKTDPVLGGDGVDDIANKQAHNLMQRTNYLKEQVELQGVDLALALLDGKYTVDDVVILHGCEVTDNIPGTSEITDGAILYNGNIYRVFADDDITSPSGTLVYEIDTSVSYPCIRLINSTSGSGIADFDDANIKYFNFNTKGNTNLVIFSQSNTTAASGTYNLIRNGNIAQITARLTFTITTGASPCSVIIDYFSNCLIVQGDSFTTGQIHGLFEVFNQTTGVKSGFRSIRHGLDPPDFNIDVNGRLRFAAGGGDVGNNGDIITITVSLTAKCIL